MASDDDVILSGGDGAISSSAKGGMALSQGDSGAKALEKLLVPAVGVPGKAAATAGVLPSGHADFVSVVDARRPGKEKEKECG